MTTELKQAARALLAHWDTPAWKYLKPTGDLMADLREALEVTEDNISHHKLEQEPVAEVVLRSCKVGFGRTEDRKDIVFLADVEVGTKLYAAPQTPDVCGEVCERAKLCYGCGKNLDEANAEHERKYGELAGTHNWTPPNYTDEQWQKLDQEYQDHVAEQALQNLLDFHQSIERNGHWSDCSTHNEPAYSNGPCDCGGYPPKHWRCACGANLYIDSNGAPASKAEQEPECKYKEAYIIWQDKTEWVQETAQPKELGMHRADVLRQRIENLQNAAPVRTKDLTDDEIADLIRSAPPMDSLVDIVRSVIAADREKNK